MSTASFAVFFRSNDVSIDDRVTGLDAIPNIVSHTYLKPYSAVATNKQLHCVGVVYDVAPGMNGARLMDIIVPDNADIVTFSDTGFSF
jgi:hypothetical protein